MTAGSDPDHNTDIRFEPKDIGLRELGVLVLLVVFLIGGGLFAVRFFYSDQIDGTRPREPAFFYTYGTAYETPIDTDFDAMMAANRDRLDAFAWVDAERQSARIPLSLAIESLAQTGPPEAWAQLESSPLQRKETYLEVRSQHSGNDQ